MAFPKHNYKKAKFPHWKKEIFSAKKKKMKKRKKKNIGAQENKRERNLKAIYYWNLLYAN